MGKLLVIILATLMAVFLIYCFVGVKLGHTAFNVSTYPVTWGLVTACGVGYLVYRIVHSK